VSKWAYAAIVLLVCLALAGSHWKAYKTGVSDDRQRSDLVISGMVNDANERLLKANAATKAQTEALQATKERADRELQTERARNERRLADARATSDLVRDQLAEFARGKQSGDDTVQACRADAKALGVSLDTALRTSQECAGDAENESATARAVLEAWPVVK
jgi:hypothetical protein